MSDVATIFARRLWLVPEFSVWGTPGFGETELLIIERIGTTSAIMFGSIDVGGAEQEVTFESLVDHRGNHLPASIPTPIVIPKPKGPSAPFIVGRETTVGFRIAQSGASTSVPADLLVVEIGD